MKKPKITLTAYGAAGEVGRSAFIIEDGTHKVLLEAGIKLRPDELSLAPEGLKERAKELDAVLLSHAHVDHSGYIPALWSHGYKGKLYMTEPTLDIVYVLWRDHLKIEGNRHWSDEAFELAYDATQTAKYRERIEIVEGISVEFLNAGHILGSAMILIDWKGCKILYTGDINDQQTPLFDGFEMPDTEIDVLIAESTNGIRNIIPRQKVNEDFYYKILQVLESGNKVIVPSFAVGRSQEILTVISKKIKDYPIYVDGMINIMNTITERYLTSDWVDEHIINRLKSEKRSSIFDYENIIPITRDNFDNPTWKRHQIGKLQEPHIIVTTSGMMMPSPLHTYLRYSGKNPRNLLAVTGYQAEGTLGREVLNGRRHIKLNKGRNGDMVDIKLKSKVIRFGFSGHVSSEGIADLINTTKPKKIFLCHGEPKSQTDLIQELNNGIQTTVLQPKIAVEIS